MDPDFDQSLLASEQMQGACGLFSVIVRTEKAENIEHFCEQLKCFFIAVSWGGYESLVIPKVAGIEINSFDVHQEDHRMIRFYVGLESADYLINDLNQALEFL